MPRLIALNREDFGMAAPLFAGLEFHLPIASVLAGDSLGRVWLDDVNSPALALLCSGHRYYLGGDLSIAPVETIEALKAFFASEVFPPALEAGWWGISVDCRPSSKAALLERVFAGCEVYVGARQYYQSDDLSRLTLPPILLPPGFEVVPVSGSLVKDFHLQGREDLQDEMRSERASVEDFLARSFGIVLIHHDQERRAVAGWCLSEYNHADRCEIGIATAEEHRRRGLARTQGLAFLAMAQRAGIRHVGWHCWTNNAGSVATAVRLGLCLHTEYESFAIKV